MIPKQMKFGIVGLLVGDALGVPYEFTPEDKIPPRKDIEYKPPEGFKRAYNVRPGTWSDDGAQALCVLDALLEAERTNDVFHEVVGRNLLAWRDKGFMAVDDNVFDIGTTTNAALNRLASGMPALEAGMIGERYQTNGSLMRVLPVAFMQDYDDDHVLRAAMGQSKVTHAEPVVLLACGIYVLWAKGIAAGDSDAWENAFERVHKTVPKGTLTMLLEHLRTWTKTPTGSGYIVDSLHTAKYVMDTSMDYESAVKNAIAFGNDTDTTAAIVGGLAGLKYQNIPERWYYGLRGWDLLVPLLERLPELASKEP